MELCEGDSLAARLRKTGGLSAREAARLGAQIAEALASAHGRGVIHRDLKPANVLFSGDDIKVADFGLARLGDSAMTQEGAVTGKPPYSGAVQEVLLAHASPAPPPALDGARIGAPGELCALVSRLLAKDPAARPSAAKEVAEALHAIAVRLSSPRAAIGCG
jgi:eukaryotic-like serine/threonine-protein kinase